MGVPILQGTNRSELGCGRGSTPAATGFGSGRSHTLRGIAVVGVALLVGLGVAEILVRVSGVEARLVEPLIPRQLGDPQVHQPSSDGELLYEMRPGTSVELPRVGRYGDDSRRVTINSLGFRDRPRTAVKDAGVFRIVSVGGSNTYGAAVGDDHTWPALLEARLEEQTAHQIEVWNLGVSGYTTRQKVRIARRAIRDFAPDLVLIQLYNTGPRYLLPVTVPREMENRMALEQEFLVGVPTSTWSGLYDASALVRLFVIVKNRRMKQLAPHDHVRMLTERTEQLDSEALRELLDGLRGDLAVLGVLTPLEFPTTQVATSRLSTIDLGDELLPAGLEVEAMDIHPGRGVYGWYAESIARQLLVRGCLPPAEGRCSTRGKP